MYSSLLIRPPHKHDKTAIASLCGQNLFLIKGVKRWHCIKNITVSSFSPNTVFFPRLHYEHEAVSFNNNTNRYVVISWFISPQHFTSRENIHVKCYHELMNVLNSWVKMKGCHVYFIDKVWIVNYTFVWLEFHTSWKVQRVHFMIGYTVPTKGNLFSTKLQTVLCMVILTLFISRTIKSFYIDLKIHKSYSHSKIFSSIIPTFS